MTNAPGVSMMEWRVSCGSGLAWGERLATKTSYLGSIGPEVENLRELFVYTPLWFAPSYRGTEGD